MSEAGNLINGDAIVDSLVCTVWKNIAPPKVEFMLWLASLGKLNTRDLLAKKGILQYQANLCSFCSVQLENLDRLLLHCQVSWKVWCTVAEDLGVQIVRQHSFRQFYEVWMAKGFHNPVRKKLYIVAFFAVSWSLWTKRYKMIFEQQELDLSALCYMIRWRIAFWSKAWKEHTPYSTEELVRNFNSIPHLFP